MSPLAAWVLIIMWGNTVPPVDQREAKAMIAIDMPTKPDCDAAFEVVKQTFGQYDGFAFCLPRFGATDKLAAEHPTSAEPGLLDFGLARWWCRKSICTDTKPLDWDSPK